jgi:ABC-type branched-subunit amino acid transport system permease subunit
MALGWCIARLGRNLASDYWGIATLAIAEILRTAATKVWLDGGAQGISAILRCSTAWAVPGTPWPSWHWCCWRCWCLRWPAVVSATAASAARCA